MANEALKNWVRWSGLWWGCGLAKHAPGTVGTLGAIPLVYAFNLLPPMGYLIATFGFCVLAMIVAQLYEDLISPASEHDASEFVLDEVAGFLITMAWVPFHWTYVVLGFLLFRLLDVVKPFPISYLDRKIPGGIGTVADDIVAGIVANVALQFVLMQGWLAQ